MVNNYSFMMKQSKLKQKKKRKVIPYLHEKYGFLHFSCFPPILPNALKKKKRKKKIIMLYCSLYVAYDLFVFLLCIFGEKKKK
jgi:hypothetical protein